MSLTAKESSESQLQLKELRKPGNGYAGSKESVANAVFHGLKNFLEGSNSCALCDLEDEMVYAESNGWRVVSAEPGEGNSDKGWENGLKGHEERNVLVPEEHGEVPVPGQEFNFVRSLLEETAERVEDGKVVVYGSMASIDDHFHLVASDLKSEEGAEPDLGYIDSYFLYDVESGLIDFDEARISDFYGLYLANMLEWEEDATEFKIWGYEPNDVEEAFTASSGEYAEALLN